MSATRAANGRGAGRSSLSLGRRLVFAALPAVVLLALAELGVRVATDAAPEIRSLPLPPESAGLFRSDEQLMWSLRPGLDQLYLGARVVTNSAGLRSAELTPRVENEVRILSLGESTTFGSGVEAADTYTERVAALLEAREAARGGERRFTSINGGVPAYSSFQSLRYLEERGFALEPDLVLFYHEVNDYLPSSLRDSSNNQIGVLKTDWKLWESRQRGWLASLTERSELLRFLRLQLARRRVAAFDRGDFENPLLGIGLPDIGLPPRMMRVDGGGAAHPGLNEATLGRRVSDSERRRIFERLVADVAEHEAGLLLIHPAYQASTPHECVLTRFARERGLPLLEAGVALHPADQPGGSLFRDVWHPTAAGHARLAESLAAEIELTRLVGPVR